MLQIGVNTVIKVANYSNKSDPLLPFLNVESIIYLDITSRMINTIYFNENFIYDDDSDILDSSLTHSYVDVDKETFVTGSRVSGATHCSEAQIGSGSCEPYLEIVMRSGYEKIVIHRRYK